MLLSIKKFFRYFRNALLALLLLVVGYGWLNYYPEKSVEELKKKYANAESEFIELDGMQVHYRDEGSPTDSIPLVLIHGTSSNLHTWDGWTEALVKDHRIIRLDLPAYGLTGPNASNTYTPTYYANFLHQFLQKLGVKRCYLAGNSLGGRITWEYALRYPSEVKKMILIDAAGYPFKKYGGAFVFKLARTPLLSDLLTKITPKSIVRKSLLDVYGNDDKVTDLLVEEYHDMACRAGNREAFVSRAKALQEVDENYKNLSKITIPTLILWGEKDTWIPLENAYYFKKDLPNDTLIVYKEAGHVPMEEIPTPTARDAAWFLAQ